METKLGRREFILGTCLIGGFVLLTGYLVTQVGSDDPAWSRLAYIYAGAEAIVFSAVGAIFGVAVQRKQTEKAETRADEATKRATLAEDEAVVGTALEAAIGAAIETRRGQVERGSSTDESVQPRRASAERVGSAGPVDPARGTRPSPSGPAEALDDLVQLSRLADNLRNRERPGGPPR